MVSNPVFVVGVPRSGTTLLAAMLSAHSRLSCGPETHVFDYLARRNVSTLIAPETWPEKAVEFLFSVVHAENPVPVNYGLSKDDVCTYLRRREPGVAAIVEALTDNLRKRVGKRRWVEKTPTHLPQVRLIRHHFPWAPIIRIVRDPRDVAHSLRRVPWGPSSFTGGLLRWRDDDRSSHSFFETDDRSITVRYEDLVGEPEQQLRRLCGFIGEEFEPVMLNTSESARSVDHYRRPWLAKVHEQPDTSRTYAWKRQLTDKEVLLADAVLGDRMQQYGYPVCQSERYALLQPEDRLGEFEWLLEDLAARSYRIWPKTPGERADLSVIIGNPFPCGGRRSTRRTIAGIRFLSGVAIRQARFRNVYWIASQNGRTGLFESAISKLGKPYPTTGTSSDSHRPDQSDQAMEVHGQS